ncbi:hypothetical protein [Sphingomonas oligoaromativorans]|uniref:hypothetical protein n=1 Tax=Sphingomonas oligoaromativorans TaxID=575322 RepID=UPI001420345D|nr:hypothetical protein [Sphingomonas oligoaromativorans]NIJ34319.1 hypothetical protein [Sphingomonas oligoaromativorans]
MKLLNRLFGRAKPTTTSTSGTMLPFKDADAFMEYQDEFGIREIRQNRAMFAQIIDAREWAAARTPVSIDDRGIQTALIRLPSATDQQVTLATTMAAGARLQPGDLVCWMPIQFDEDLAEAGKMASMGWVGFITAKIAPTLSDNLPTIIEDYRPAAYR